MSLLDVGCLQGYYITGPEKRKGKFCKVLERENMDEWFDFSPQVMKKLWKNLRFSVKYVMIFT